MGALHPPYPRFIFCYQGACISLIAFFLAPAFHPDLIEPASPGYGADTPAGPEIGNIPAPEPYASPTPANNLAAPH